MVKSNSFYCFPDDRDPAVRYPDLTPVVLGLSACGNLVYDEGDNFTLKCIVRGSFLAFN